MNYFEQIEHDFLMDNTNSRIINTQTSYDDNSVDIKPILQAVYSGKRIIICGKAASGKDHLANILQDRFGMIRQLSVTTRPMREGEVNGEDYLFVPERIFFDMYENKMFQEIKEFNEWNYGTLRSEWLKAYVFILTPSGIKSIEPADRSMSFIIFLDISDPDRKERLLKRSDADRVDRRLKADNEDFHGFEGFDMRITHPEFEIIV